MMIELNTEIRHIPQIVISELGNILETTESWKDIMSFIPSSPWVPSQELPCDVQYERKYSSEDIK